MRQPHPPLASSAPARPVDLVIRDQITASLTHPGAPKALRSLALRTDYLPAEVVLRAWADAIEGPVSPDPPVPPGG